MVYLNGNFIAKNKASISVMDRGFVFCNKIAEASISVMDRGFLFGDGVYEVIPVYQGKIFRLTEHLDRLQNSLDSIQITNPYSHDEWQSILTKLSSFSSALDQSLYLQITRGADTQRKHNFDTLTPTVYIETSSLIAKTKSQLENGFSAMTREDIRWHRCDIKATSLLPIFSTHKKPNNIKLKR